MRALVGIRRAISAVPGLDDIRRDAVSRHTRWLAEALIARGIEQSSARVRIIARDGLTLVVQPTD